MIRVANAPVSYGAFELTVGVTPNVPGPDEVLASIAAAGYEGTELGPLGYLGDRATLRERIEKHGLELVGGFVQLRFGDGDEDLGPLDEMLDHFDACGGSPRAVLSDGAVRGEALDWRRFAEGVARAAARARERGYAPTFHHHMGSRVETPVEIERLLELTDVGLLLDTGHLTLGGGDPLRSLREWQSRVNHVHVKDVRTSVLAESADMADAWRRGVFCELGSGDVDLEAFLAELISSGYSGWLVVEQDRIPVPGEDPAKTAQAQLRNRRWLAEHAGI